MMSRNRALPAAILFFALALLFIAMCERAQAEQSCAFVFGVEDANKIILFGEGLQQCQKVVLDQDEVIKEQDTKAQLLELANQKLTQALDAQGQANTALKEVIRLKDEQHALKAERCNEEIKKAKPGFFRDLGVFGSGVLGGIILTIVGLVAL